MNWREVPIPHRMRALIKDERGYPVPYVVLRDSDGKPHFTVNDSERRLKALKERRCHVCGSKLDRAFWFVGGPLSAFHVNGCYNDGPLHKECMEYALRVCPYLALTKYMGRIDASTVDKDKIPDGMVFFDPTITPERPPLFVCVETMNYTLTDATETCYIHPRRPYMGVQYWRSGERLTDADAHVIYLEALGVHIA